MRSLAAVGACARPAVCHCISLHKQLCCCASPAGTPCLAATDGPLLRVDPSYSGNYMVSPEHVGMLMLIHTATQQPGRISLTCIPASPHRQQACCFASVQLLCLKLRFMQFLSIKDLWTYSSAPPTLYRGAGTRSICVPCSGSAARAIFAPFHCIVTLYCTPETAAASLSPSAS